MQNMSEASELCLLGVCKTPKQKGKKKGSTCPFDPSKKTKYKAEKEEKEEKAEKGRKYQCTYQGILVMVRQCGYF
jgi:hypothetical protein